MPSIARRRRLLEANHGRCLAGNASGVDGDAAHFVMLLADRPPATRLRSLAPWVAARWPPGPLPNSLTCAPVRSLSTGMRVPLFLYLLVRSDTHGAVLLSRASGARRWIKSILGPSSVV